MEIDLIIRIKTRVEFFFNGIMVMVRRYQGDGNDSLRLSKDFDDRGENAWF